MKIFRGQYVKVNFFGKAKDAFHYGTNETGIHCFVLKRKSKRPDGTSTKYVFTKDLEATILD